MNFMGSSTQAAAGSGFYEEDGSRGNYKLFSSHHHYPSSSSPSQSPSSSHQKGGGGLLPPPGYHQQRGWLQDPTQGERCEGRVMMDLSSNNNNNGGGGDDVDGGGATSTDHVVAVVEREHMFDKVVTPSDVGKLNRLVIPKQHAEKYFPLDSSVNEKGLLLNFEDRNGKPWRFRYSYWNSSQSYVMTKGWSRFVKEKKLDAGDIVSFQRGLGETAKDRLFIDWRRRPDAVPHELGHAGGLSLPHHLSFQRSIHHQWNPLFLHHHHPPLPHQAATREQHLHLQQQQQQHQSHPNYNYSSYGGPYGYNSSINGTSSGSNHHPHLINPSSGSVIYFRSAAAAAAAPHHQHEQQHQAAGGKMQVQRGDGAGIEPLVYESVPVVHGKAAAKRLRLFGVNMECPISASDECDILSSTTIPLSLPLAHHHTTSFTPPHLSSSSSSIPYLQLRPYSGGTSTMQSFSSSPERGKSSMSLDFNL